MKKNKKLRLLVTTLCPNKCLLCCNKSWDFKDMEWIIDCPVPKGEDFRRVLELWSE